ncbi:MAG: peptidoglycan DD-metalloendopeptidase family protein [Betaproteobacteria bacterium]
MVLAALVSGCATRTQAPVVERTAVPPPPMALQPDPPPVVVVPPPPAPPPVPEKDWRPEFYTVKRGDTLHAIALEHGLDYRELAALNNIENVNLIRVGQVLRVRVPSETGTTGGLLSAPLVMPPPVVESKPIGAARPSERGNTDTYKSAPKAIKMPYSEAALAQLQATAAPRTEVMLASAAAPTMPSTPAANTAPAAPLLIPPLAALAPAPSATPPTPGPPPATAAAPSTDMGDDKIDWGWPARGRIVNAYSESASLKGIDIGGTAGHPVVASAPGRVVYAGSGLRGYGKLVIVKHNKTYLSAYAHLDAITIREGQNVSKGQELGKMGNSDADQVKLHFEIRALGKPVDPMRFLPRG